MAKDQAAVASAKEGLTAATLKATLSVHQAQSQVSSASLGVTVAKHGYALKIVPATAAQIAADKASVASAQQALTTLPQNGASITMLVRPDGRALGPPWPSSLGPASAGI